MARFFAMVVVGITLGTSAGCIFQARECCECMATKQVFVACLTDSVDNCTEQLSKDPPNVDVVQEICRPEEDGLCPESCADVLYRK